MKKSGFVLATFAMTTALCMHSAANAAITITRTALPGPTFANTLNFDEAGGPTGTNLPTNSWASNGIASIVGYDTGMANVLNLNAGLAWAPDSNVLYSAWGLEINFAQDVSSVSFQAFGNGGNPSPFGGGNYVSLYDDNYNSGAEVAFLGFNASWGGVGNQWITITSTDGSKFDRLVFTANAFPGENFIDNMSWSTSVVPAPGAFALLGLAGLVGARRRRSA